MDTGIVMKVDKNFHEKHTLFTQKKIHSLDNLADRPGQPPYIQMVNANNQSVAFIGNRDVDEEKLVGKYLRVDKMVIPEFAQLVDPDVLDRELSTLNDNKAVEMTRRGLLLGDKMPTSVLLDVVGMIHYTTHKDMHFHNCKNKKEEWSQTSGTSKNLEDPWHLGGSCPFPILSHYFNGSGNLQHSLMIFYISREDLASDEHAAHGCYPVGPGQAGIFTLLNTMKLYFQDRKLTAATNPDIDWDDDKVLEGIFLIPIILADQRVVYYCLPNVDGPLNKTKPAKHKQNTKAVLAYWLKQIEKYNTDVPNHVVGIQSEDNLYLFMERLSLFFIRDATPFVLPKKDLFQDLVLANEIS